MQGVECVSGLRHWARMEPGDTITVRVTPKASRARIAPGEDGVLRVWVTVVPEGGKANKAVQAALAKHLGVPKTALRLIRGEASREKTFRLE